MSPTPPNLLLITTDQQRWDTCGPAAPAFLRTPHLDQLGHEGIRYRSAYADCPVCVPARVSLMTGQYATTHGMIGNGRSSAVMGRDDTLPGCLRRCGYQTAAIGKMHFGPQRARHGFDEMILPEDYYRWMGRSGYPLQPMRHGLGQNELYPSLATVPEALTLTSWTAEQCVDYLRERRDPTAPFFLWCSFAKPHPPLDPPEPYYSMYRGSDIPPCADGDWTGDDACPAVFAQTRKGMKHDLLPAGVWRDARAAYYGLVTQIDYQIGRVLGALADAGLYRDTVILFTSDHGELLGDHRAGGKCYFHEGSAHVPFLLRLPWDRPGRRAGTGVDTPVTHADILPTLVGLAGGTPPGGVDGVDLLAPGGIAREYVVGVGGANVRQAAITDGRWKYFWFPQGACEQLFDLAEDPLEERNLAALPAARGERDRLRDALTAELRARGSDYAGDSGLVAEPVPDLADRDLRAGCGNGFMTEYRPVDTRH